jgi:Ni/Fe-hydrogenase subunit HybB-like protein
LDFYSGFFLANFFLIFFGSLILLSRKFRASPRWVFISAALIVLGGALYRFNVYLIGFNPGQGWTYFPSLIEFLITVGIIALELLGYQVLVKLCPVLPRLGSHGHGGRSTVSKPSLACNLPTPLPSTARTAPGLRAAKA